MLMIGAGLVAVLLIGWAVWAMFAVERAEDFEWVTTSGERDDLRNHDGEIVDNDTGEAVRWDASPMVLPVSDALKAALESEEYELALRQAATDLHFEIRQVSTGLSTD